MNLYDVIRFCDACGVGLDFHMNQLIKIIFNLVVNACIVILFIFIYKYQFGSVQLLSRV